MRFLAAAFLPLALFFLIAWLALPGNPVDVRVAQEMKTLGEENPAWRVLMIGFTHAGGVPAMVALALAGAAWLIWRRAYFLAMAWVGISLGGGLLDLALKETYGRSRPPEEIRDQAVSETNESFPSGHAMGSTIGYGLVAYLVAMAPWSSGMKKWVIAVLIVLIVCIGFSRVFLRAHWLSDVLAGFCIGLAWLLAGIGLREMGRPRRNRINFAPPPH